jgi:predicted DNA-binding transcriptional regulator AlpA
MDRVVSLKQAADYTSLSAATLQRLIANGEGPPVTQLSPRRIGFRESHLNKWLAGRLRDQDGEAAA